MDNLKNKGPQDRSRINLSEEWELEYWSAAFHCTRDQLREAVKTVGNSADEVRMYLHA